ncbi:hypothetical protein LDL08_28020 [Nonomuraea glycinis]|uniref:hypothetical protein n=1 Tax=Nonomuraea glycinis TaxID=2047744 RepID=UPI001CD991BD|nr:hypothetical protein [Nonomuraea glycinis]MCA2180034.1 hypothetical protein [Nonomuraea glycinis]
MELVVDQQAPNVPEGDTADQLLDVNAPVSKGAPFFVRFRDLGLESYNALEAGFEVGHSRPPPFLAMFRQCLDVEIPAGQFNPLPASGRPPDPPKGHNRWWGVV